ncbi:hypothetical protein C6N75_29470 [Streptomyces solincola]|uniref:Uncharacterized protein n=1 Tax=Streptomyces solincola TaxID=2100817 RepID=A0A2S9PMR6_9ACTN|nr:MULTISPECIES: hypothetical protein [Streptomyces]PRH75719.1 hypothetical protein C6N75_29470 [Streptomyces solincola]
MSHSDKRPETAAEELLDEFERAELDIDDEREPAHDKEAADAMRPGEAAEESVQSDAHREPGDRRGD